MGRREIKSARRLEERKPTYTLHHLVRERRNASISLKATVRYPSFEDALRDLDDAVPSLQEPSAFLELGQHVGALPVPVGEPGIGIARASRGRLRRGRFRWRRLARPRNSIRTHGLRGFIHRLRLGFAVSHCVAWCKSQQHFTRTASEGVALQSKQVSIGVVCSGHEVLRKGMARLPGQELGITWIRGRNPGCGHE